MIINKCINSILFLCVVIFFKISSVNAHDDFKLSLYSDGYRMFFNSDDDFKKYYDTNKLVSKEYTAYSDDNIPYFLKLYTLKGTLYKLIELDIGSEGKSYYRIQGYKENDFIHLYKITLNHYFKKRNIIEELEKWNQIDSNFKSIDFINLIKVCKSLNNHHSCMLSECLIMDYPYITLSNNPTRNLEYEKQRTNNFSYFSNKILFGRLPRNISYRRKRWLLFLKKYTTPSTHQNNQQR